MKRMKMIAIACLAGCLSCWGQGSSTLQRRPEVAGYTLGPGDQVTIQVTDLEEMPAKPLQIDPDGLIDLPLIGRVHASGMTIEQLKSELQVKLSKYITAPQVAINLTENRSTPVSVLGSVNTPGVHQLDGPKRLMEVISLSGGVRPDAGDQVVVTRQAGRAPLLSSESRVELNGGFSTAKYSLDGLLAAKHPEDNIFVEPGDLVTIPKADLVSVVGDVKRAGSFTMSTHSSMSLLQALTMAEGVGPHASAKSARILRPAPGGDGTRLNIPVDVNKILAGKAPDLPLYANDVLYIPNSAAKAVAERALEAAIGVGTGLAIYSH